GRSERVMRTLEVMRNVVVATRRGTTIRVADVADVRYGALPRNGVVTTNAEREAVWGLVLGLRGANAKTVVTGVKQKFEELKPRLPPDTRIAVFYDRSDLIQKAVTTVEEV